MGGNYQNSGKLRENDVENSVRTLKEMLTIESELKMLTAKSHLCYPRLLTMLLLSSQKDKNG